MPSLFWRPSVTADPRMQVPYSQSFGPPLIPVHITTAMALWHRFISLSFDDLTGMHCIRCHRKEEEEMLKSWLVSVSIKRTYKLLK